MDLQKKETNLVKEQEVYIKQLKNDVEKFRSSSEEAAKSSNKVTELLQQIKALQEALEREKGEKKDLITEKEKLMKDHTQVRKNPIES